MSYPGCVWPHHIPTSSANTRNVRVSHTACLPRNGTKPPLSLRTLPVQQIGAPRWDSRVVLPRGPSSPCSLIQSQHILEWLPARLQYSSPQDRWPADILFRDPLSLPHHDPTSPSPSCMGTKNFIEQGVQRNAPLLLKLYDLAFGLTPVLLAGRVLHDRLAVTTV